VAAWRSGNIVERINEVTLRRARLVLGWVTVFGGQKTSVFHQATQANSAFYPSGTGNEYQSKCGYALRLGSKGRYGWIKMPLDRKVGLIPSDIVLDGDPVPPVAKRDGIPQFPAHVYCGQTPPQKGDRARPIFGPCLLWPNGWMHQDATWYGGRPQPRRLCVRCGPSFPIKRAEPPANFLTHVYCGQTAGWTKTPLGTEVDRCPGHIMLDGDPAPVGKGHSSPPPFGPCLLWPRSPISATAELLFM